MRTVKLSLYNLMVIVYNVTKAVKDDRIGFVECNETVKDFMRELNKNVYVDTGVVERGLYYCVMLDEEREFWHPNDINLDTFIRQILPESANFDRIFSSIESKEGTHGKVSK